MRERTKIVIRAAKDPEELSSVYRLRHDAYVRKCYISANPSGMMSDEWDELAGTTHFVALESGQVIGAVRLVVDSAKGLPMDRIFSKEICLLRGQSRKLAEASTLVTATGHSESDRGIWVKLCKALWERAENGHVDHLCIAVTENHLGFYRRLLFKTMGESRRYESLNGILAYPLQVQVREVRIRDKSEGSSRDQSLRRHFLG